MHRKYWTLQGGEHPSCHGAERTDVSGICRGHDQRRFRGENGGENPPQPPVTFAWVYDGSRMLEMHLTLSRNQAFHRDTNSWVPLHSGMLINVNNAWVPIQLDAGNNVIL